MNFKVFMPMLFLITSSSARLCPLVKQPTVREGHKLTGHVITTYSFLGDREVCIEACASHDCCYSVNFYRKKKECELNKGNHVSKPENMTATSDVEYIDCPMRSWSGCNSGLGMEDKRISDNQLTESSAYGDKMRAYNGRLNLKSTSSEKKSWASKFLNLNQWLQVHLLDKSIHVCAIATQGFDVLYQWVTTYSLQYSDDGVVFTDYKAGYIFQGNRNRNGIVKNDLIPAIVARYIRVLPKSWNGWIVMRIELYGCAAA